MSPSPRRTLRVIQLYSAPASGSFILCVCCSVFSNTLKWAPEVSGALLCMLSPLLHSVPHFQLPQPPPNLIHLFNSAVPASSAGVSSLCAAVWNVPLSRVTVIIARTSFVFSLTGITSLCSLHPKQNMVVHIFYPVSYLFAACYPILEEADISNLFFLPHPSHVQGTPNYCFPILC